jgi:hypothetical protein
MALPVQWMFDEVYDLLDDFPPVSPPARYPTDDMVRHYLNMGQFAMWPRIYRVLAGPVSALAPGELLWDATLAYGRLTYVEVLVSYQGGDPVYVMVPDEAYDMLYAPTGRHIVKIRPDYVGQLTEDNVRVTVALPLVPIEPGGSTTLMALSSGDGDGRRRRDGDGKGDGDGRSVVVARGAGAKVVKAEGGGTAVAVAAPPAPPQVALMDYSGQFYSGPDYSIEGPPLYAMSRIMSRGLHRRLDYGRMSVEYQNRSAMPNELMSAAVFFLDEFERRVDQWRSVQPQSLQ